MRNGSLLSRTAAILLLIVGLWGLWSLLEAPILARVAADREAMAVEHASLTDARAGINESAQLRSDLARVSGFVDSASWDLDRSTPELLAAQLQRAIDNAASAAGAVVSTSRTLPAAQDGGLTRIGLDFELQTTLPSLQTMLLRINAARPRVFIDRLTAQVAEAGDMTKGADGQRELGVTLRVAIYAAKHRHGAA
jgi:hypothetical protein